MHQTFDKSVPLAEQVRRIIKTKTGRKHQHRIGPGRKQRPKVNAMKVKRRKAYIAAVRAYWAGNRDTHP